MRLMNITDSLELMRTQGDYWRLMRLLESAGDS